jgi:hypothetical protein
MLRDASGPPSSPTSRAAVEDYDHAGRARLRFGADGAGRFTAALTHDPEFARALAASLPLEGSGASTATTNASRWTT